MAEDTRESIEDREKAVELDPRNVVAWATLGISYGQLGNHQQAVEALQKALGLTDDPEMARRVKESLQHFGAAK